MDERFDVGSGARWMTILCLRRKPLKTQEFSLEVRNLLRTSVSGLVYIGEDRVIRAILGHSSRWTTRLPSQGFSWFWVKGQTSDETDLPRDCALWQSCLSVAAQSQRRTTYNLTPMSAPEASTTLRPSALIRGALIAWRAGKGVVIRPHCTQSSARRSAERRTVAASCGRPRLQPCCLRR